VEFATSMHTLPHAPIVHGNLFSNNVLVNDNLVAMIGDFKTAHMISQANYDVCIMDLFRTSNFTGTRYNLSCDVFSFVVM